MTFAANLAQSASNNVTMRNKIINGAMTIDQRNAGASVTVNGGTQFGVDRFFGEDNTDGVFTLQQSSVAPVGFTNSLLATITTADTSLSAAQLAIIGQRVEGFNIADLNWGSANAQPVTLSFWVRSSLTGTFGGAFWNDAGNRSYPYSYTISAANTWEYKTVTVAGDTTGTWLTNNGRGVNIAWSLGVGSDFQATAGAWTGSLRLSATGAVSVIGTLGATFQITGVQLEEGTAASPFENRLYGTELQLCQRYFFQVSSTNAVNGENAGITGLSNGSNEMQRTNMTLPVTMRVTPTISVSNVKGTGTDLRAYNGAAVQNVTALGSQRSTPNYLQADWTLAGNFSPTGQYLSVLFQDSVNGGWIRASAEL
jgi:hypothetical protein